MCSNGFHWNPIYTKYQFLIDFEILTLAHSVDQLFAHWSAICASIDWNQSRSV